MTTSDEIAAEMNRLLKTADKHVIVQGDNLWDLAKKHNITVDDITAANPNTNLSTLKLKQEIIIPSGEQLATIRKARELPKSNTNADMQTQIDAAIKSAAASNNIKEDILRGLIITESGGDWCAQSASGAQGLCQIMPATAVLVGVSTPMDPVQNVYGGAKWLAAFYKEAQRLLTVYPKTKYNIDYLALMLYNVGGPAMDKALSGKTKLPKETLLYPAKVIANQGKSIKFFCSTGDT